MNPSPDSSKEREALNIADGVFLASDGCTYPITNWIDADGEECDRGEAVACVAGAGNRWWSLTLADFERARTQ